MESLDSGTDWMDGTKIDLYENGKVRLHANGRTIVITVDSLSPEENVRNLIYTFNDLVAGEIGEVCPCCATDENIKEKPKNPILHLDF